MKWPRLTFKRIAWTLGAFLLLCVISVGLFIASEWTYIRRMRQHPANSILDAAWYRPTEAVAGAGRSAPAFGPAEENDPAAFAEAANLAEPNNAAALVVIRRGRVALERHWHGH